ncbi:MAG: hypothetical protein FJZ13_06225 [Candidatus Omnitrophica bacterium]|nr:hypothetical protein [Candidatus Omnitrophota bacterium]
MPREKKFRPVIMRIRLNYEQVVLYCACYSNGVAAVPQPDLVGGDYHLGFDSGPHAGCNVFPPMGTFPGIKKIYGLWESASGEGSYSLNPNTTAS